MKQNNSRSSSGGSIYTLAQTGTNKPAQRAIMLIGKGSDLTNEKSLKGRAKRKLVSQKMVLKLIDVENAKGNKKSQDSYWNTYYCQNEIFTAEGRLYGRYCKNRFCTLCCSIRKAVLINKYLPFIKTWEQPYFVTLTIKSVPMHRLRPVLLSVMKGIKKIIAKHKKRSQRKKGVKFMGIRSLECNFNARKKTYNPHFHLIVPNREVAKILVDEWLTTSKSGWNLPVAQKMSRIINHESALIEVVKYGSKIFSDPDLKKKEKSKGNEKLYLAALNNIFNAMKGIRIFERFGFNLPAEKQEKHAGAFVVEKYKAWQFDMVSHDWIDSEGKKLTDFKPDAQLLMLLDDKIDIELE